MRVERDLSSPEEDEMSVRRSSTRSTASVVDMIFGLR